MKKLLRLLDQVEDDTLLVLGAALIVACLV
jgi:hypothetical protein